MDSRPARSKRASSRSTSLRAASGSSSASSRLFFFAELLADSLHLLAQQHLALTLAQFFLDLSLNVFLSVEHRDLALHVDEHPTQPVFDRNGFEQLLALARLDVEVSRDEIRQGTRVRNALQHLLHDLIG